MKVFLSLIIISIFLSACSAPPSKNVNSVNSNISDNSVNNNSVTEMRNANVSQPTMEEFMNANRAAPAGNTDISELPDSPMKQSLRKRAESSKPIDPNASKILTTAPDNSEISTRMDKDGTPIETRTFKSSEKLAKVERIYTDLKNPTIRVYLKNGKTIDLPKDKISDIFSVSANEILKAAGVAPSGGK